MSSAALIIAPKEVSFMPNNNIHKELRKVRQWERSAPNRLKSIEEDAVRLNGLLCSLCLEVSEATQKEQAEDAQSSAGPSPKLPVSVRCYANLRCGEWYLPSCSTFRGGRGLPCCATRLSVGAKALIGAVGTSSIGPSPNVYFKSADSHYGHWQFSAVRLNLQLLEPYLYAPQGDSDYDPSCQLISVIVDATQQGKRFPDALSKTVPIWCLVVNEVLYYRSAGDIKEEELMDRVRAMLPQWVTDSECSSIAQQLPSFVKVFQSQLAMNASALRILRRPLKCEWVSAADGEAGEEALLRIGRRAAGSKGRAGHDTIVLLCASGDTIKVRPRGGWFYVTGGADDHESWGQGLSPSLFWDNAMSMLHPNGLEAPMPSDPILQAAMEEVIEAHAKRCRQLANGDQLTATDGSSVPTEEWYHVSDSLIVHCGPSKGVAAKGRWLHIGEIGSSQSHEALNGGPLIALHPLGARIQFDFNNKIGLQRAAFSLLSLASYLMAVAEDRPIVVLSVAIREHMPIAVAVVSLLMTLMTRPEEPSLISPIPSIVARIEAANSEGGDEEDEVELPKDEGLEQLLASLTGCITEAIATRPNGITKEWIRSCHQRASSACGGVPAPRSLMQQINQYFLTMDSFGKNSY